MSKKLHQIKKIIFPCRENNYRPLILDGRFLSYLALTLFFLKFITLFYLAFIPQTSYFADITGGLLVKMANEERSAVGTSPLKVNSQLTKAAEMKARDMINNNYFAHWSPDGKSPWFWIEAAGYSYEYAGENLAMGFLDTKQVHNGWINSPTHRDNIINPNYEEVGIAVVGDQSERNTFFVVQMFGTSRTVSAHAESLKEPEEKEMPSILVDEPSLKLELEIDEVEIESDYELEEEKEEEKEEEEELQPFILGDLDTGIRLYPAGAIEINESSRSIIKFLLLEYDDLIQKSITIILLFLGFILIINVFVRFDVQHPDLIFKGLAFLVLFIIFDYLNQPTIIDIFYNSPIIK